MGPDRTISALILAAGAGRRFGGGKLLAPLHGRPLASHAADTIAEAIASGLLAGAVAVVPPANQALTGIFSALGIVPLANPDAASGLSSSLRVGLAALQRSPGGAALIVLADQPRVRREVIETLVQAWRANGTSVRPRYAEAPDEPGHPVLLDRSLWTVAGRAEGDAGLRAVLSREAIGIIEVAGGNPDVDTVADLERL